MPRSYHHGDLREALLEAAERILRCHGVNALTLRAVAREAGVTHGSPSHHFRDFRHLLSALAARGFERLRASMLEEGGPEGPGRLAGLGRGYVRFAQAEPNLFLLMFRSADLDNAEPALASASARALDAIIDGEGRDAVVRATARWAFVHGLALLAIDGRLHPVAARAGLDDAAMLHAVFTDRERAS